jgi:subtilisin family serine protease/flagellar hook assembly protein FlgD
MRRLAMLFMVFMLVGPSSIGFAQNNESAANNIAASYTEKELKAITAAANPMELTTPQALPAVATAPAAAPVKPATPAVENATTSTKPAATAKAKAASKASQSKPVAKFSTEELFKQLPEYDSKELMIHFHDNVTTEQKQQFLKSQQLTEKSTIEGMNISLVEAKPQTTTAELKALAIKLANNELVEFIEPNNVVKKTYIPKDTSFKKQWYLNQISAPKAWDITKGSPTITVAVIDDGTQKDHPDLAGKIVKPYDAVTGGTIYKPNDHGTHVAGIIAASINGKGIAGVAPNVKIMPINAFTSYGASNFDVARAIYYASINGANVINMSLGGYNYSYAMDEAVGYAFTQGSVIIAAAGNSDTHYNTYPASYDGAFGVSATNRKDQITQFSNYGNYIDFAAPGEDIFSTVSGSSYEYMDGTSMASPVVAGVAALVLSKNPLLSPNQVKSILASSAIDLGNGGWDFFYGYGRVNAYRALQATPIPMSNITSNKTFTMKGTNRHAFSFKAHSGTNVSIYIKNQGGTIVKRLFNQPWSGGTVTALWDGKMDNGNVARDGKYKLVATASGQKASFTKSFEFNVVDKMPPSIKFTNTSMYLSPIAKDSLSIPIELNKKAKITAIIYDNTGAKVRTIIENKPLNPGAQALTWNGKNNAGAMVKDGSYQIAMTAVADNKLASPKRTATIILDSTKPTATFTLENTSFKLGDVLTFKGQMQLSEKVTVNAYIADAYGTKIKQLAYETPYSAGTVNLVWDGTDEDGQISLEGNYRFVVELTDFAGNQSTVQSNLFALLDWTSPTITSDYDVEVYQGSPTDIWYNVNKSGKVTIGIYQNGRLLTELVKDQAIFEGNNKFTWSGEGYTGGEYQAVITFTDQNGQRVEHTIDITLLTTDIQIQYPRIVQLIDSSYKRAEVFYELSHAASVTIEVYSSTGYKLRTIMKDQNIDKGIRKFEWNGRSDTGSWVNGDEFIYFIRAKNQYGKTTTVEGKITNKVYPDWLYSQYFTVNRNTSGQVTSVELDIEVGKEMEFQLSAYTSLTSSTPYYYKQYVLSAGSNHITYTKDTSTKLYYYLTYRDHLGNMYWYAADED